MNCSAAADLSGQEGPHGAVRAGLPSPLLDRLHSVCQRCSLSRPSSCRNPKVIYTNWLQNICFTNRSVSKGLSALIRTWGGEETQKRGEGSRRSLPHLSPAGWLTCVISLMPLAQFGLSGSHRYRGHAMRLCAADQCKPNSCHCTLRHRVVLMNCTSLSSPCSSASCTLRWFICSNVRAGGGECWWNVIWEGLA